MNKIVSVARLNKETNELRILPAPWRHKDIANLLGRDFLYEEISLRQLTKLRSRVFDGTKYSLYINF